MIIVVKGRFSIYLEDQEATLEENEAFIIPRGLMHSATAQPEAWIIVIE